VPGGVASNYLSGVDTGQHIEVEGPAGVFNLKNTAFDKIFLVTGTGIAPIRSFLLSHPSHTQPFFLFWGMPTLKSLYLFNELRGLAERDPLFRFFICLSRESDLSRVEEAERKYFSLGHIDAVLQKTLPPGTGGREYYVCGGRDMVEAMRVFLYNQNIDRSLIYFERY
jgi:ferredoxin-NADP reductase